MAHGRATRTSELRDVRDGVPALVVAGAKGELAEHPLAVPEEAARPAHPDLRLQARFARRARRRVRIPTPARPASRGAQSPRWVCGVRRGLRALGHGELRRHTITRGRWTAYRPRGDLRPRERSPFALDEKDHGGR